MIEGAEDSSLDWLERRRPRGELYMYLDSPKRSEDLIAERTAVANCSVGVDVGDGDLDRSVVLGGNEAVYRAGSARVDSSNSTRGRTSGSALAGDVKVDKNSLL